MSTSAHSRGIARAVSYSTSREALLAVTAMVLQCIAILAYVGTRNVEVVSLRETLYPVVWITVSVYVVAILWRHGPSVRNSPFALAVAGGYFLLIAVIVGMIWPGHQLLGHHAHGAEASIAWSSPGWGPTLLYSTSLLQGAVIPFKLVGYLSLAYAIGAAVAASSRGAVAGIAGVFSCVGCLLPILGAVGGVVGSSGVLLSTLGGNYDIGTAVFVLTMLVLVIVLPTNDERSE